MWNISDDNSETTIVKASNDIRPNFKTVTLDKKICLYTVKDYPNFELDIAIIALKLLVMKCLESQSTPWYIHK